MAVTNIPDPLYVASVPLQYVFIDKDTGGPLSAGVVKFYSQPEFPVRKDVYQITNNPDNTVTFANLGDTLVLSSIGTFVDDSGENLVPYYYPWTNPPSSTNPGDEELYYVEVYNSSGVLQFTLTNWPPNVDEGGTQFQESLTANLLSNPDFSVVSFVPTPPGVTYAYDVTGSGSLAIAPGWTIEAVGTGTITVKQISESSSIEPSQPPYLLNVAWTTGFTQININQELTNSPRLLAGSIASATLVAEGVGSEILLQVHYLESSGPVDEKIAEGIAQNGIFTIIAGSKTIPATSTDDASGSVTFSIQIGSLTVGSSVSISSVQMTQVGAEDIVADYMQQSTQQELNGLMWYYQPMLSYKPIPSYLVGWDFPLNPCQPNGTSLAAQTLGDIDKSQYVWDQTIIFQSLDASITVARALNGGLTIGNDIATSFAVIQYLPQAVAREILSQRNAVQLKGKTSATTLVGTVGLYWTAGSLPDITSPGCFSLVSGITDGTAGAPPVVAFGGGGSHGTWTQVPNAVEGVSPPFTLTTTDTAFDFSGFDATASDGPTTATYFAIVLTFNALALEQTITLDYCSLMGGDIATRPGAQTPDEVLRECQYYYESSYVAGNKPGDITQDGEVIAVQHTTLSGGTATAYPAPFGLTYKVPKVSNALTSDNIYLYNPILGNGGNDSNAAANWQLWQTSQITGGNVGITTRWTLINVSANSFFFLPSGTSELGNGAGGAAATSYISYQYVIDSRLGVV